MFTETRTLNLQRTPSLRLLSNCDLAGQQQAAGVQFEDFVWGEAVITGALPEVSLLVLPSDGWRVLPADLQVYPPIWRAGGRLANTLMAWCFSTRTSAATVLSDITKSTGLPSSTGKNCGGPLLWQSWLSGKKKSCREPFCWKSYVKKVGPVKLLGDQWKL